jgi:hypothetical protein
LGRYEPRDGSLDAVIWTGRLDDEPETDVDHVDDPNGTVEVESITEHEFPWGERLRLDGLHGPICGVSMGYTEIADDGPVQSETQCSGVKEGWSYPIDTNPVGGRTGDTALTIEERDDAEESRADSHESDLEII